MKFDTETPEAIPLVVCAPENLESLLGGLPDNARCWAEKHGFKGELGQVVCVPDDQGGIAKALAGIGTEVQRKRIRFSLAAATSKLPAGLYIPDLSLASCRVDEQALGLLLSSYRFDLNAKPGSTDVRFAAPAGVDPSRLEAIAAGEALTRDLINMPANMMGPDELEDSARKLADRHGAEIVVTTGGDLLKANLPMIHTVGRASNRAPRLIDMTWGTSGPSLVLVGKGVCFDTGGLNLKPGSSMGLMKKDMGGAATVLGLAQMIMALGLKLRLRVLIPAVENAVSGNAFRPGDILTSRKGLTVEINNTDAEGRLVLADALALADEGTPDRIVSFATLTGAARVAVGPDLAPFYATEAADADALRVAALDVADPVWEMPFHTPYEAMIEPGIADLDNAPSGGFAGSITAALFLRRFVEKTPYMHFDIYGWQPSPAPARPKGGVGQGARALLQALPRLMGMK